METKFKEKEFSMFRAIRNNLDKITKKGIAGEGNFDEITADTFKRGEEQVRKIGMVPASDMVLPLDLNVPNFRADILAGTPDQGAEIVGTEKSTLLKPLSDRSVLLRAGATFITGLSADYSLPEYLGSTAKFKGEVAAADDGGGTFSDIDFLPYRITAVLNYSRRFILQDSKEAEQIFYNDLIKAVSDRVEKTILSNDALVAGVSFPGFLKDDDDKFSGNAGVTWAQAVGLATAVQESKSWGLSVGYVIHPSLSGLLKQTEKVATTGQMIIQDNMLNGYPFWETGNMSKLLHTTNLEYGIAFINFEHIIICLWGGFEILIDPMTYSKEGKIRMIINTYFDAKLRSSDALAFGSCTLE